VSLKEDDNNTKFFHIYAQYMKDQNKISDIKNINGELVSSHSEMEEAEVELFSTMFKEKLGCPSA